MEPLGSIMENMPDTKPDILVELKLNSEKEAGYRNLYTQPPFSLPVFFYYF